MMERKKILDEGLLEKYLLDELNESEKARVERAINSDDVLKKQFQELEADFEKMALENAIIPPTIVKDKLKEQLEPKIVRKLWNTPLLVAASISALFFFTSIWMYTQWQNSRSNFESLQNQTTDLQERLNTLEKNYVLTNTQLKTINGPQTIPLVLYGNDLVPDSKVVAYVNHQRKMVLVNTQSLPKLGKDKAYQMWSDVDGEMIDMGLLPTNKELHTLKYIDKAESLNITIEPAGGNDHPTVEKLVANVKI